MKTDKTGLYTTQQIAYSLNMAKSTVVYRLRELKVEPIIFELDPNHYYDYSTYLKVQHFGSLQIVEVEKIEVLKVEINWAFAHSRMNFENIDTRNWKNELKN